MSIMVFFINKYLYALLSLNFDFKFYHQFAFTEKDVYTENSRNIINDMDRHKNIQKKLFLL